MRSDLSTRKILATASLPVAASLALVAGAPQAVAGVLALMGLAASADLLARCRRAGTADRLLLVGGGLLVVLVLTGMLLGSTPLGLSPTTWVVASAILAALGLAAATVVPTRVATADTDSVLAVAPGVDRGQVLRLLPWVAVASVLAFSLVRLSGASLSTADAAPLQMSFGRISGTDVQLVVSSTGATGPLEVRTATGGAEISYPLLDVSPDGKVTTTLSLPRTGRVLVTLNRPDQTTPLRTLILDR